MVVRGDYLKVQKKSCKSFDLQDFAERERFEPPVPLGTTVFKTVVIDHSTISPCKMTSLVFFSGCKGTTIFSFCQIFMKLFLIFLKKSGYTYACRAVYRGCLYKNGATAVAPNLDNLKSNTMKNTLQR